MIPYINISDSICVDPLKEYQTNPIVFGVTPRRNGKGLILKKIKEVEEQNKSIAIDKSKINEIKIDEIKEIKFATKSIVDEIKDIIFNDPATIVLWKDGTKTVVKATHGDEYDKRTGVALCVLEKLVGSKSGIKTLVKKYDRSDKESGK